MRKYVLIGIAIFLALICILQVFFGFGIGKSYGAIKKAYRENINAKENLDKMNNEDYNNYQKQLNEAVAEFKTNQEQYEQRNAGEKSTFDAIDKAELKTTLTKYAKNNLLDMTYDIKKASGMSSVSSEFVYCDIEFVLKGGYYDIDKFIETIENDFKLGFTAEDFEMKSADDVVEAKFVVKNVAIKEG